MASVLVVEDDELESRVVTDYLTRAGHLVTAVPTAEGALEELEKQLIDVVVTDLHLPGISGIDLLSGLQGSDAPPIIVVTGDTDVGTAVEAMRMGASDYVTKPLTMKALGHVLSRVVETSRLRKQLNRLKRAAGSDPDPALTAVSQTMRDTLDIARRCAASPSSSVLLVGESGSGKEVVAAYIHRNSPRCDGPFVRINIAAIPETMLEAELFGSIKGAYTGSSGDREGFFAAADGGTLLLDEIGELRPELQAKLLRVIESHRYYPVGATREVASDVRIIAATNRSPDAEVSSGRMRADLYYRLASVVIELPSLRHRPEDVPLLGRIMLEKSRSKMGRGPSGFSEDAIGALQRHLWPGNVRELRNIVERVTMLVDRELVTRDDLKMCGLVSGISSRPPPPEKGIVEPAPFRPGPLAEVSRLALERAECDHIRSTLEHTGGNRSRAADLLGISRSTLWKKMRLHGLDGAVRATTRADRP